MDGILVGIQLGLSLLFLAINMVVLLAILRSNRQNPRGSAVQTRSAVVSSKEKQLNASDILGWEFEYARVTASEAMEQRHTMVNFYLLAAGIAISGVVAVMSQADSLPKAVGTVLLWLLCGIGWVYFLAIIRLRQAWHDSARTMNQIKDFYIHNAQYFAPTVLRTAFRWKSETLPPLDKTWTVHFYSAMLIALIDSVAYVAGGLLLNTGIPLRFVPLTFVLLFFLGLGFFYFHIRLYYSFLKDSPSSKTPKPDPTNETEDSNMPAPPSAPDKTDPLVEILKETVPYTFNKLFRIVEAELRYRRFDGRMSEPIQRVNFERGDAVGVLLYDAERDAVVLVCQFRYPVYAGLPAEVRRGEGAQQAWLVEIVAGIVEGGQSAPEVGRKELLEEAGYKVQGELQFIATIYPSPGGSSERIHIYWGEVSATEQTHAGGGLEQEGEDTQVVVLPFQAAMDMIASGEIKDGKTILALQHLALLKRGTE